MANSGETRQNGGTVRSRQSKKQTNSTLGVSTSPVRKLKEKVEEALVLSWDDIPHWRRDNTFLLTGYRQSRDSYLHSLKALFYLHNESVNIWTHLSGAIITFLCATYLYAVVHPRYETATKQDILVFGCFFGGAVLCLGMSATFHTLIAHSESVMKWGNKLDYTGIVFLIVGSYMPALYYGLYCQPDLMKIYMAVICTLGLGCGIVSWVERFRTPAWRPYRTSIFVGLGTSGIIPVIHGISIYGYSGMEDRMSISYVIGHGAMYIFGAFLYAVRWPERSYPVTFDIWGSSHQIFHVCVVTAVGIHLYGMSKAFDYHHTKMGSLCLFG